MTMTEEKIRGLLIDAKVIQDGHFKLNSGVHSDTYLEKFNLLQWPDLTELICKEIFENTKLWGHRFEHSIFNYFDISGILN